MKQFTLLFFSIIVISLVSIHIVSVYFNAYMFPATNYKAKKDTVVYKKNISSLFSMHAAFDEKYYKFIAQDEIEYSEKELIDMAINVKNSYNSNDFTSKTSKQVIEKIIEYSTNAMLAKATLAKSNLNAEEFMKAYDALEYNMAALIAMMNIAETIYNVKLNIPTFMPNIVTDGLLEKGACKLTDSDEYEETLAWFISNTALRANYDTLYLQLLFGSNFYSKLEISNILKKMNKVSLIIGKCQPPLNILNRNIQAFYDVNNSFKLKKRLAEYNFVATIPDEDKIRSMIYSIYSTKKMPSVMYEAVGFDSFKTVGSVTIFELYLFTNKGRM